MKPVRSGPRAILLSLALALLIIGSAQWVAVVAVYVMRPPPAEPDLLILVVVAALTLGPSIALGLATRRARVVAASWDLGKAGGNVIIFVSILMVAILGIAGLYPVVRLVKMLAAGNDIAVATQSLNNDAKADIAAALIAAKKEQKHVLLNFGAVWCAECRLLDKIFADSAISQSLKANFVVVKVDVGRMVGLNYTERNIDLTLKYGAFTTKESIAIPFIVVLDADGRVLDRTNKGEWKHAPAITQESVLEALRRWAPKR